MKQVSKQIALLLLIAVIGKTVNAQRYEDVFRATNADMLKLQGKTVVEYALKGATLTLPNGSNQLKVTVKIPYDSLITRPADDSLLTRPGLLFDLKVTIDPAQIADMLTSTKTFLTTGSLLFNNITRDVSVQYMPIVAGTEETGSFNMYMSIQFTPRDFNLNVPDSSTRFVMKINNAKVNRL
jgi:hypothetical protein